MQLKDDYRASQPKVEQRELNKSVFEHTGRALDDGRAYLYHEYDSERNVARPKVVTKGGNERMPLGFNVCSHCARDMETRHGTLADGQKVICPHCHAWHYIP